MREYVKEMEIETAELQYNITKGRGVKIAQEVEIRISVRLKRKMTQRKSTKK